MARVLLLLLAFGIACAIDLPRYLEPAQYSRAGYDYLVLSMFWPPSQVPADAHSRARHLMHMKEANAGFWTHGLWPSRFSTAKQPEYCTMELFKPEALGVFETSLMYYLRSAAPTALPAKLHSFWSHEWSRHGSCYGDDQLSYFLAVYRASSRVNVFAALSAAGITPRNDKPYTKGQIQHALAIKYGSSFGAQGLSCTRTADDDLVMNEVRLCLDASLNPIACTKPPKASDWDLPPNATQAERSQAALAAARRLLDLQNQMGREEGDGGGAGAGDGDRDGDRGEGGGRWRAGQGDAATDAGADGDGVGDGSAGRYGDGAGVGAAVARRLAGWGASVRAALGWGVVRGAGGQAAAEQGQAWSSMEEPPGWADAPDRGSWAQVARAAVSRVRWEPEAMADGPQDGGTDDGWGGGGWGGYPDSGVDGDDGDDVWGGGGRMSFRTDNECLGGPDTPIYVPDWLDNPVARMPWDIVLGVGALAVVILAGLVLGHHLADRWQALPSLFVSRSITIVHYAPVQQPVKVLCEPLDMEWMWTVLPAYAEFVDDLPVGMGIKGGIARKLLKEKCGAPEPPGSFDVDVLLFIDQYTNEARSAAREAVAGMRMGGLVLEPQDVEVLTKGYLSEYFITRDVTMNEVLILKTDTDTALFFYTEDAHRDAAASLIRPSVHCLKTEYHLAWSLEDNGTPYTASQQVVRSLVRYLKGHGRDYAFDTATWVHYRKNKLTKTELFKVLKPFHDKDEKMQNAVDHLMSIGFLSRSEVRKAGGVNMLWGLLLQDLNKQVARHGGRLMLTDLNPQAVERWVDHKKASVAAQLVTQEMRARRTGFAPAEENIVDLNGLFFPPELHAWILDGQVFSLRDHLSRATDVLIGELGAQPLPRSSSAGKALSFTRASAGAPTTTATTTNSITTATTAGSSSSTANTGAAQAKQRWLAVKAAAAVRGEAVWTLAMGSERNSGSEPNLPSLLEGNRSWSNTQHSPTSTQVQLAGELAEEVARLRNALHQDVTDSPQHAEQKAAAHQDHLQQMRTLEALQEVSRSVGRRNNKGFKAMLTSKGGVMGRLADAWRGTSGSASQVEAPAESSAEEGVPLLRPGISTSTTNLSSHDVFLGQDPPVNHSNLHQSLPEQSVALPGTFYQVMGTSEEEAEYVPLVSSKEGPTRKRVEIVRLLRFLLGVMALEHRLLVAAYALLLAGLVARLCLPRIEAAIFDAFNDLDSSLFRTNLLLSLAYIGADIVLSLAGKLMLEMFARFAMRTTFRRFFQHVIFQDLPFFDKLSPGELMARTSGDSLTLRTLVCTTMYELVEGCVLFVGSLAFLTWSSDGLLASKPGITVTFVGVVAANVIEGALLGSLLRRLNLSVRQALGRMFGFTLDAFIRLDAVSSLGLEPRMLADYNMFARDYFANSFYLNASMHCHRAFTTLLAAVMRAALLWFGGAALFSDLTTVGALFAMLRYIAWMQKGMRGTSNACARLMAGMGSVERIVELHDRGVFGAAPSTGPPRTSGPGTDGAVVENPQARNLFHAPSHGRSHSAKRGWATKGWELLQPLMSGMDGEDVGSSTAVDPDAGALRPDWSAMMGGVKLDNIHLTMRSRTDKLLLHDCSITVMPGEACLLSGDELESKTGLLALVMLRMVPYKGSILFQLPDSAIPPGCALGDTTHAVTPGATPLTGGQGWKWVPFSFRQDDMRAVRALVSLASMRVAGVFRTTLEDNIAVAAPREVTNAEVRDVCKRVGLYDIVMQLPDGFGTVVGEGSGHPLSQAALLKVVLARCLLRKPKILLLDDADAFSDALGPALLVEVLQELCGKGCVVILASGQAFRFPFASKAFMLRNGKPMPVVATTT